MANLFRDFVFNFFKPNKPIPKRRWVSDNTFDISLERWVPKEEKGKFPSKPFANAQGFKRKLTKKGFVTLGTGHFSTVMMHPHGDRVIKVCHEPDAWIDYCYWAAMEGYAGTFAPKVYSYKRFNNFYVAVMEKMEYTASRADKRTDAPVAQTLFSYATKHDNDNAKLLVDLLVPGLAKFGEHLKRAFKDERLDLHDENVMFRKDGSICITDPLCHSTELTITRLRAKDFGPARAA